MSVSGIETDGERRPMLIFTLGDERFAIPAGLVREIMDPVPVTEVPGARPFVGGLINVRGRIVPLADLRLRLGMAPGADGIDTRFIVVDIDHHGEPTTVGLRADKVHEVVEVDRSALHPVPAVGLKWNADYIDGIGRINGMFIMFPNIGNMLWLDESG